MHVRQYPKQIYISKKLNNIDEKTLISDKIGINEFTKQFIYKVTTYLWYIQNDNIRQIEYPKLEIQSKGL